MAGILFLHIDTMFAKGVCGSSSERRYMLFALLPTCGRNIAAGQPLSHSVGVVERVVFVGGSEQRDCSECSLLR